MRVHLVDRARVDQRAVRDGRVEAVADGEVLADGGGELGRELVVDGALDEDAVGAHAGLTGGAELAGQGAGDGGVDVGVGEDDEGRVAAELEGEFFQGRAALAHEELADGGGAGEGDLADGGVGGEGLADARGVVQGGDEVDDAAGDAGAVGELGEGEGGEGGFAGGLAYDGAADGEGGADLARDHGGGEVPGGDEAADADGLLERPDAVARRGGGDCVAVDARGFFREPLEEVGGVRDLALGVGRGLAVLPGDEGREVVGVLDHEVVPFAEELGAVSASGVAEGLEGGLGGFDGGVGVVGVELGASPDELAGCGVWGGCE